MRTLEELTKKLRLYNDAEIIYEPPLGYIVWHYSTGDNIEVLYIEALMPGTGAGVILYQRMVKQLQNKNEKPYHSVFGFRLASNDCAGRFYDKLGWTQVNLGRSIYAGDETVLMWTTWDALVKKITFE